MAVTSVGLFCAASELIDSVYVDEARKVGTLLGDHSLTLFYGGAAAGLMEATAKAAKAAGARVVGVVPQILIKRDRVSRLLDDRIVTSDLSGRKDAIIANSDILVALPGGVGTLDEIFHLMAGVTIGYHSKRIILYNVNGFWDSLVNMLVEFREKNFLRGELCNYIVVVNNIDELENIIKKG